jgi:diazepam-binding inhibitor (GABA receptor modulating acyl-CoA-binding protein)
MPKSEKELEKINKLNKLEEEFNKAADDIKNANLTLDNETMSILYGNYKQALEGDCNMEQPGFFDFKGKAKYEAWNECRGLSKEKAMKRYIKKVNHLITEYN